MSRPEAPPAEEFGAGYWEDRYRSGEGAGGHGPSPSLVTGADGLRPGQALDAGCGVGGDTLWLAAHGWQVTAVDVSPTALERGLQAARAAGPAFAERVEWVCADLTTWEPGQPTFDLVSSHYVHVPGAPEALFRRLASWVAPGGTLLVVGHRGEHDGPGHDGHGGQHGDHHHPPGAQVRVEQVLSGLSADEWHVVAAGPRTHTVQRPGGGDPVTLDDVVVHLRRLDPPR